MLVEATTFNPSLDAAGLLPPQAANSKLAKTKRGINFRKYILFSYLKMKFVFNKSGHNKTGIESLQTPVSSVTR
jgi:hypothetical protein